MGEIVIPSRPVFRARGSALIAAVLIIYAVSRIIEVLPFTSPSPLIVALEVVSALALAMFDGIRRFGLRSILMFATICLVIGGVMETIGVRTGFPYGHYQFLPLMGPQVMHLPVLLGLAYIGMPTLRGVLRRCLPGRPTRSCLLGRRLGFRYWRVW